MFRPSHVLLLVLFVLGASAAPARAQGQEDGTPEDLDATRATLAKWMETQQVISREKKDWQTAMEVLEQRISLIEGEIAGIESRMSGTQGSITELDRKRMEMVRHNDELKQASAELVKTIGSLEARTVAMLASLPEPLLERVSPLARRIPRTPAATELSLSERFQNVIGILNEVNKFNRDIMVASEIRRLPGGESAEVKVLYLGLSQAYFVSPNGDIAGIGQAGDEGWEWIQANELAGRISQAIAIIQNEAVPAFVPLPVEIR
jgi:hypothetical protein